MYNLFDRFYQLNYPFWTNVNDLRGRKNENILVFVKQCYRHPNYVIKLMLLAKKIQEETLSSKIVVGFFGEKIGANKRVIDSFGASAYVNMLKRYMLYAFIKTIQYIPVAFSCKNGNELLSLCIDSMPVGECIYDAILRQEICLTINDMKIKYRLYILKFVFFFFSAYRILKKKNVSFYIFDDNDYLLQAFVFACKKLNIRIFQINRFGLCEHKESGYKLVSMQGLSPVLYEKRISALGYMEKAESIFKLHFSGNSCYPGFSVAYKNKKTYSKEDLLGMRGGNDNRTCVLVASHAFSDNPHGNNWNMVFKDYYDWLFNTVKILSGYDKYHVFVKEHPESASYGEQGSIDNLIRKYNLKNIILIPSDCNTYSLFGFMDCILTCCGTIGIEAACFGIPVITAAKGYYYGYGLDFNCSSYDEYVQLLGKLDMLKKRPEIIDKAKAVLALPSLLTYTSHPSIFPSDSFYGENSGLADTERMSLICNLMKSNSPKDEYYNTQLENTYIMDDSCCPLNFNNKLPVNETLFK